MNRAQTSVSSSAPADRFILPPSSHAPSPLHRTSAASMAVPAALSGWTGQAQQQNGAPPQHQQQQQPPLPFPSLIASSGSTVPAGAQHSPQASGPGAWGAQAAPFPHILPPTLASGPPAASSAVSFQPHPQPTYVPQQMPPPSAQPQQAPPRLAAHVQVPASLLQDDDDGPPPLESAATAYSSSSHHAPSAGGHSHDGQACNHSHASSSPKASSHARTSSSGLNNHGHSHGAGGSCSSDHSSSSLLPSKSLPPLVWDEPSVARPAGPLRRRLLRWLGLAWFGGGDSRSVLIYVSLKVLMTLVQLWWGLWAGNTGMVSSSFHTAFDVVALLCALLAMLNAKYPAKAPFTYGFDRQEVVAAFTNSVFLFFVATFMIIETFHTAYSPPELERSDVAVAFLGLGCDAVGLVLFGRFTAWRGGDAEDALQQHQASAVWGHGAALGSGTTGGGSGGAGTALAAASSMLLGANNARGHYENMHGVSLHVLADLVGHSSLLGAVWILASFPWFTPVFACSFLLSAVLTIRLVLPLFRATGAVLLQTTPAHLRVALDRAVREVSFFDGVLEMRAAHWWTQAPGVVVGSMHVRIRADANEQHILAYVHGVLRKYCALLTVQIEKDQMPAQWSTHMLQA